MQDLAPVALNDMVILDNTRPASPPEPRRIRTAGGRDKVNKSSVAAAKN